MKLSVMKRKKRPGFTLVELVIVVTILGILSGLGFMKFDKVQTKARQNADYVAAMNLATAANLCKNEKPEVIESTKDGKRIIELQKLQDNLYISLIPKPQSVAKDFVIIVNKDDSISVMAGETLFYPRK